MVGVGEGAASVGSTNVGVGGMGVLVGVGGADAIVVLDAVGEMGVGNSPIGLISP